MCISARARSLTEGFVSCKVELDAVIIYQLALGQESMMATIKEIADLAGVSRGTVDRVLNNRGEVNAETAARIKEIVKALDYRPNKAGLALAVRKRRYKIGVILFSANNPFFDEVMEGVNEKALELEDYGVSVLTRRVEFEVEEQLSAMEELEKEGIHGLLIAPYNDESIREKIDQFAKKQIPVVTVNTDIEGSLRIAYVGSDYFQGGRLAAGIFGLLMSKSAEVAIITGSSNVLCHSERIRGFKEVLGSSYPDIQIAEIRENHDDEFESYVITKQILETYPKIDGLFFTAAGVQGGCKAVIESRRKVKVVTFDEVPSTLQMLKDGVISVTIGQQPFRQGFCALTVLFENLTSGNIPDQDSCIIELTLKIRENIV